jgi:hypothetical protein
MRSAEQMGVAVHQDLKAICDELDRLEADLINSFAPESTLADHFGAWAPHLTKYEIAEFASTLAADIRRASIETVDAALQPIPGELLRRLTLVRQSTVSQIYSSNASNALPTFFSTLDSIRNAFLRSSQWITVPEGQVLPAALLKKVKAQQAQLDQITPHYEDLKEKIERIELASKAADDLPIDLQALADARAQIATTTAQASVFENKLKETLEECQEYLEETRGSHATALNLVERCEDAFQITTTKGLAGAFEERASSLQRSIRPWIGGLVCALFVGAVIGWLRLESLTTALQAKDVAWGVVVLQTVLSALSVGAPLWFAWLATRQISQRFKLAEDYAYKASVAKAYEGYKKQATELDPAFLHRLFSSALTRLEEAPLRLVEERTHGSPLHDLANSTAARRLVDAVPEAFGKAVDVAKAAKDKVLGNAEAPTKVP